MKDKLLAKLLTFKEPLYDIAFGLGLYLVLVAILAIIKINWSFPAHALFKEILVFSVELLGLYKLGSMIRKK